MTRKIVEYSDVTINRAGEPVLQGVTFDMQPGDFRYLTGRVGSGKSTLLKTLYAQVPIASGQASVLDYDLTAIKHRHIPALRRQLGIVFQDFQLLMDRNVLDNLKFVLRATGWRGNENIDRRIEWALTQVGLVHKAYEMPHRLSGGEQQRVVIARALLNSPQLILADEPTGNLDQETSAQIMQLLHGIADSGTAVIMATHNLGLIEQFPAPVMHCKDGTLTTIS